MRSALRFWQITPIFKCPVVGLCFTYGEQKQLLKKAGISWKKESRFEMHETLVAYSDNKNRLSRKADNLLKRKFGKQVEYSPCFRRR
jgi:hypothetical protein